MNKRFFSLLLCLIIVVVSVFPSLGVFADDISVVPNIESEHCCGTDPELIEELSASLIQKKAMELQQEYGISTYSQVPHIPNLHHLMPSTGEVKMLVLPVAFPDYPEYKANYDAQRLERVFFADYDPEQEIYYQSARGFYDWSSYGKMKLSGKVLPVYDAPQASTYYEGTSHLQAMYHDIIQFYIDSGVLNLDEFDGDGDGYVDSFAVITLRPMGDAYGFWWPMAWSMGATENKHFENTDAEIWQFIQVSSKAIFDRVLYRLDPFDSAETIIHETGHLLGLKDNYYLTGSTNIIDDALQEVMAGGDLYFNSYYKWLLDWIEPVVLTNEDEVSDDVFSSMELYATEDYSSGTEEPKAIVLIPDPTNLPFAEFFIAEYRKGLYYPPANNNYFYEDPGVVIWHCTTALNATGTEYASSTAYLAPVRKTGTTEMNSYKSDDSYSKGDVFSSDSSPVNSSFKAGDYTGAYLEVLDLDSEKATIKAGFRDPDLTPPPTFEFSEFSVKAVRRGSYSLVPGTVSMKYGGELFSTEQLKELFPKGGFGAGSYETVAEGEASGTFGYYTKSVSDDPYIDELENPTRIGLSVPNNSGDGILYMKFKAGVLVYAGKYSQEAYSPIIYVDSTKPELTLKGDNPQEIEFGTPYTELGVTVTDNLDPDIISGKLDGKLEIDSSQVDTTQAGEYTVTYTATDHAGNTATATRTVVVKEPAAPEVVSPPKAKPGLVYDGTDLVLVEPGKAAGGTMEYSLKETEGYSDKLPTAINADEYPVWYRVRNSETGAATEPESIKVTIAKAAHPKVLPENFSVQEGTTLSSLKLPDGWTWKNPEQELKVGDNRAVAVYADTRNYEQYEFEVTITVTQHPHKLTKTEAEPATCTNEGRREYWTCSECKEIFSDEQGQHPTTLEALKTEKAKHTPGKAATCTDPQICTVCREELAPALKHSYKEEVTKPTCTGGGYTTHTCEVCGDSYVDQRTEALGHTPGDPADCTHDQTCTTCGAVLEKAKGHKPGKEATCTEAQKCTVCHEVLVKAKGHTPGDPATCTEPQKCTVCREELAPALGHSYKEEVTKPTCTAGGFTTHTCEVCGNSYVDQRTEAKGHTPGKEATCTESQECTVCHEVLVKAKGHTPGDPATCTEPQECTVCNEVLIKAKGHKAGAWEEVKSATETEEGLKQQKCTVCHEVLAEETIPKLKPTPTPTPTPTPSTSPKPAPGPAPAPDWEPEPEPEPTEPPQTVELPFTDVNPHGWYIDAIQFAVGNGLMNGTTKTKFEPNATLTRGMLVQILYNMEGKPAAGWVTTFKDVPTSAWYAKAVAWAANSKVVAGNGDGTFSPNAPITREQMAVIFRNYTQYKKQSTASSGSLTSFSDGAKVSRWAEDAMQWAVGSGLLSGKGKGDLDPKGNSTRAEAASVLMKYCEELPREVK